MGAKTWMMVFADGDPKQILSKYPALDRKKTEDFAKVAFPGHKVTYIGDGSLESTCPPGREVMVGCFPGLTVVAAEEFGVDYPSKLSSRFLSLAPAQNVSLFAMHSVVDFFAFAIWTSGRLVRSVSVSGCDGAVLEDVGERLAFEIPFWNGKLPAVDPEDDDEEDPYPLKFHPLEFGDAALSNLLGYSYEGPLSTDVVEPDKIALMNFSRKKRFLGLF